MVPTSPARRRVALLSLALGGFAIGSSEFVGFGLLPEITRDLLPEQVLVDPESATAQAAWFVSVYALGVVVGGPLFGGLAARFGGRRVLLGLVAAMMLGTLATALVPGFALVLVFRGLAALPHAAYFGSAALVAAGLLGDSHRGRGVAFVLGGLTMANVVGVPIATAIGQTTGWAFCYLLVAALFALCGLGLLWSLPADARGIDRADRTSWLASFAVFRGAVIWQVLAACAFSAAALFAVVTYVSPLLLEVGGVDVALLPVMLAIVGVGMTIGNFVGGAIVDRRLGAGAALAYGSGAAGLGTLAAGVLIGGGTTSAAVVVTGIAIVAFAAGVLAPYTQVRLIDAAVGSAGMGSSLNSSVLNLGNAMGAILGGAAITVIGGFGTVAFVGLALLPIAVVLMLVVARVRHPVHAEAPHPETGRGAR